MNGLGMQGEQLFWMFRCTEKQYAQSFLETGNIKLNTPYEWIKLEESEGKGRGDLLEGVFAHIERFDFKSIELCVSQRSSICPSVSSNTLYFRSDKIFNLPCFCLYALSDKSFTRNYFEDSHSWANTFTVGEAYFKDFYDYESRDAINSLPDNKKPVLLVIRSPKKFFERMTEYLIGLGVCEDEIYIQKVNYIDKSKSFITKEAFPNELFLKDISFAHQSEIRVVINTMNQAALRRIRSNNNIINIGNLSDIAIVHDYYLNDMLIELRDNTLKYVLPVPVITYMDDFSHDELLSIIMDIEKTDYEFLENYEKEHILEHALKFLDHFEEQFGERISLSDEFYRQTSCKL